jgi:LytS/YehU family sensor histidine kinase
LILGFIANYLINKFKREKTAANHQKEIVELETGKKIKALEIQILYAQMNPHFVFNCLTAIQHLFLSGDRQNANSKLNSFSRLLRLSIDHVKNDYVTLDSELKFLKHYIDLEQLQFKEAFKFELINNIEEDLEDVSIPSMMLQPYVENAINHGLKSKKEARVLTMTLNELENNIEIIIEDNGIGRVEAAKIKANSSHQHESRGLSLVHEKILALKDLYGDDVLVTTSDLIDEQNNPCGTRVNILFSKKIN